LDKGHRYSEVADILMTDESINAQSTLSLIQQIMVLQASGMIYLFFNIFFVSATLSFTIMLYE